MKSNSKNAPHDFLTKNKNKIHMNYLGFDKQKVTPVVNELNKLLCNYHVYYQNLRNFHWNITGENFFDLHSKFEELYNDARIKIDEIAERILTLRHRPLSRLSDYITISDVSEATLVEHDREMVIIVLENHRIIIENLRSVISAASEANDEGTIDMAGGFLESLEKKSWMLDAWALRKLQDATA
ncbi:MAG: DNA starvation/stationary phase protection protein [Bacteroidota bacterium]